jgi:hypothetical protein
MDNSYYVYALLDPRKIVSASYSTDSFGDVKFDFEPFYIGKGKGNRLNGHVSAAIRNDGCNRYKESKIRNILRSGLQVVSVKIKCGLTENYALDLEEQLIRVIGRKVAGRGTLTNILAGGDLGLGMREAMLRYHASLTKEQKALRAIKVAEQMATLSQEERSARALPGGLATASNRKSMSAGELAKVRKRRSDGLNKFYETRSEDDAAKKSANISEALRESHRKRPESVKKAFAEKASSTWSNKPILACPHCPARGKQDRRMAREHFDNCKLKR